MLTKDGKVKLTDFGLAKLRGAVQLTVAGSTLGTAAYMSPEQMQGVEVDNRSDLFSLGVVMYELTTSHLPFRGEHQAALAYSIVNEDPQAVKLFRQDVPEDLEKIIKKCLEKDRSKRYQNAEEVASDLLKMKHGISGHVTTVVRHSKLPWIAAAIVVLGTVGVYLYMPSLRTSAVNSKTIAVLPFTNMSGNPEDEYFSDGITDDILTQLSKISNLKVISRTSVMQYKGTKKTMSEIGKELHAGVILEGSVRRADNRIRINAQMIDANTDEHLWAEAYDRDLKGIFEIQTDVAIKIAGALKANLVPVDIARTVKKPTESVEAYNLYLKGRFFWNQRTTPALKKGIDFFQQAIELDPTYAAAYSGLADCYTALGYGSFLAPKEAFPKAKAAAIKALELDSTFAEPHASLGYIEFYYHWDWNAAEKQFKTAISLNPNYVVAYDWYSVHLTALERSEEAREIIKKAQDLDPLSVPISTDMGFTLYYSAHYDEAIKELQATLEMNPKYHLAHLWLGRAYQEKKMYDEAITEYEKTLSVVTDWPVAIAAIGYVYGVAGKKTEAHKTLDNLKTLSEQKFVTAYGVALVYAGLGEKDQAFAWLNKSYEERSNWLVWLKLDPRWNSIRSDPRFADLVRRVGLPS